MNTHPLTTTAALATALVTLGGLAYAFGDSTGYRPIFKKEFIGFIQGEFQMAMDQTQQNTLAIARQEFVYIEGKKDRGAELTWEEKRDFCTNAKILEYPVEGCTRDGEPIITFQSKTTKQ